MPYPGEVTLLTADRARIERLPVPVLIDEWQRHAPVWDLVRRSVDRDRSPGRFVITGSGSPKVSPTHSGAGRIVRLRMRPMSLAERALISPAVSLAELLSGERPDVRGDSPLGLEDYVDEILRSGFPGVRTLDERNCADALDSYLAGIVERDFPDQGHVVRRRAGRAPRLGRYGQGVGSAAPGWSPISGSAGFLLICSCSGVSLVELRFSAAGERLRDDA